MAQRVFAKHGLEVNFQEGKTECVAVFSGVERAAVQAQLIAAVPPGGSVPELPLGNGGSLRVVRRYRHLGILAGDTVSMLPELATRCAAGLAAVQTQHWVDAYLATGTYPWRSVGR